VVSPPAPGGQRVQREEHDACALLAWISRSGQSTRDGLEAVLDQLGTVHHRAGFTAGEGDGAGVMVDLPRALWADLLAKAGHPARLAYEPEFAVVHLFLPPGEEEKAAQLAIASASRAGYRLLHPRVAPVCPQALGPRGRQEAPTMLQLALLGDQLPRIPLSQAVQEVEEAGLAVVSWSSATVVYKVRGDARTLQAYYQDLQDPRLTSSFVLGHLRFSTNTQSRFDRVQPFPLLGHNGEINTIQRLRLEALTLGVRLAPGASDSQDVSRLLLDLVTRHGLRLVEAMTLLFPPVPSVLAALPPKERDVLQAARDAMGPVAQGPAAIVARYDDEVVCTLDALGLRPLWLASTPQAYWVTSERAVVPFEQLDADPRPLAPGEMVAFRLRPGGPPTYLDSQEVRAQAVEGLQRRGLHRPAPEPSQPHPQAPLPGGWPLAAHPQSRPGLFGFDQEDLEILRLMADQGVDPIGSLGYDGPLAALAQERRQVSDFLHETVAVVTNPAIDRERETEHFSLEVLLGTRPPLPAESRPVGPALRLASPFILEDLPLATWDPAAVAEVARRRGATLLSQLALPYQRLDMVLPPHLSLAQALEDLAHKAEEAVRHGAALLVLDDGRAFCDGLAPIDPLLGLGAVQTRLAHGKDPSLRRRCGILVRSAGIRRLHDVAACLGLGADAVDPYLLWYEAAQGAANPPQALDRLLKVLGEGLEKVMSTMGTHELRGYALAMSSVGLAEEVRQLLGVPGYLSQGSGHGLARWEEEARQRLAQAQQVQAGTAKVAPARMYHIYPKIWKAAGALAAGQKPYGEYARLLQELEETRPVALRHLLDVVPEREAPDPPGRADPSVGEHDYPLVLSSMSFGSQGEVAYRAYLEGAARAGILCLNGEGGELPDLIGRYGPYRGVQVASGRFGISAPLLARTRYLEIKIGQGAKPGEGGHLPARKVSAKVARARNVRPGVDLISPSNNHDLYSIEDLQQLIDELREVSPQARILVKVPVVPGIGTIAVGIAKAGADVITLSGFDGGTGAARRHSIRHVGLPAELGLWEAHGALLEAGLRAHVELWCDGGMRSAEDVLKCLLLGANRVAFGTLPMVAMGCTICRACQADTCHVGITTQIESVEEAQSRGLRRFVPRHPEEAAQAIERLFRELGEEVARRTAQLGYARTQDLVGHAEHLVQRRGRHLLDLSPLLEPRPCPAYMGPLPRPAAPTSPHAAHLVEGGPPAGTRMVGTALAGHRARQVEEEPPPEPVAIRVREGKVVGQGFAAFHTEYLSTVVLGGAQDGAAKCAVGGRVAILKGRTAKGVYRDGAVGKSFAYGAQGGRFFVQGDADSRAAVRLSGASIVFGARPRPDVDGSAVRANLKGFAFEYMTGGTVVCLGDPGPWMAAGMTGGIVYVLLWPDLGLDLGGLRRRLARGARVELDTDLAPDDRLAVDGLLTEYAQLLEENGQEEEARWVRSLLPPAPGRFARLRPYGSQMPADISTE
jgi:glutamate synthase (NADPH/NADH) large chain